MQQIFVQVLSDPTFVYQYTNETSVLELKTIITEKTGIEESNQALSVSNNFLTENSLKLSDILQNNATVFVNLSLLGGKKGKKKGYTTRKKTKHKHKNVKLSTLKYYTISNDEKIQRTRKVCPDCGPGFFMAKHFDRHYCGKCHRTLKVDPSQIKGGKEPKRKPKEEKKKALPKEGKKKAEEGEKKEEKKEKKEEEKKEEKGTEKGEKGKKGAKPEKGKPGGGEKPKK